MLHRIMQNTGPFVLTFLYGYYYVHSHVFNIQNIMNKMGKYKN